MKVKAVVLMKLGTFPKSTIDHSGNMLIPRSWSDICFHGLSQIFVCVRELSENCL